MVRDRPYPQKTIGVLGGLSNIATAEYYRLLNEMVMARAGNPDIAETLIAGMNFGNIEKWLLTGNWPKMEAYFNRSLDMLEAGGVDFVICASNTCHKTFDTVMKNRKIPYLHIADATAHAILDKGLKRVSLFGTRYTMEEDFIKERLQTRFGINCVTPNEAERAEIDRIIYQELCKGEFPPSSRDTYLSVSDRLRKEEKSEGLIMGCTEIGLLIRQSDRPDFPMFDTTQIHCAAAADYALGLDDRQVILEEVAA